ncbi:protein FAM210A-like [Argopecten irradians]|uniref:protein FAM210A-like n=1 Tax=Argopecten irradians TaxID=31199 RepID=UPI00371A6B45
MFSLRKVAYIVSNVRNRSIGAALQAHLEDKQPQHDSRFTTIEGVQGNETAPFSVEKSIQILEEAVEYSIHGPSIQGIQGGYDELADLEYAPAVTTDTVTEIPENIKNYSYSKNINLHGCMQTNVPEPYAVQSSQFVTQLDHGTPQNMPGNGRKLYQKYISGGRNDINNSSQKRSIHIGVQNIPQTTGYSTASLLDDAISKFDTHMQHVLWKNAFQNCDKTLIIYQSSDKKYNRHAQCKTNVQGSNMGHNCFIKIFDQQHQFSVCHQQKRQYCTAKQSQPDPEEVGNNPPESSPNPQDSPSKYSRANLKKAIAEYGSTVIVFHVSLALMSLGGFYVLVSSGIDVVGLLTKLGIGESIFQSKIAAGASTFVIAYAVHKVFAPVRIGITLTATPFIVQYLRRVGFLKAPKVPPKAPPKST